MYRIRKKDFSQLAQKTLSQLEIALDDVNKISIPAEMPDLEKNVITLKNRIRGIIMEIQDKTVTFFEGREEVTVLHLDKEIEKFETERALLNNQIRQIKVEAFPEPKMPKIILPIAVALFPIASAMLGIFPTVYGVDWNVIGWIVSIIYFIAFLFLIISLHSIYKFDKDKKKLYEDLFSQYL